MARIEGIRIRNFRVLNDVTLGKLWNTRRAQPLTPVTAVIGENGAGKSSLFDAFGFLADCLRLGVDEACDARGRGGFGRLRSRGSRGPIEFEIRYREEAGARPVTYELAIDIDRSGRPCVLRERLRQRRKGQKHGRPSTFLMMSGGKGVAWKGEAPGRQVDEDGDWGSVPMRMIEFPEGEPGREEGLDAEIVELQDTRKTAVAILGALKQHPRISSFRQFVEGWHPGCYTRDASRGLPLAGPQTHPGAHGGDLGNVVRFLERENPGGLGDILDNVAGKIPGIDSIRAERSPDGRLLLRFGDRGPDDPFHARQASGGTLKALAYLLMLEDPAPAPFICIEEPENGLHHKLLGILADEFHRRASGRRNSPQILVTTHQPCLVDALGPDETWILEKGEDGFSAVRRASDDGVVGALVEEGLPLGGLWYSGYLDRR